jgi:hypothetical protein
MLHDDFADWLMQHPEPDIGDFVARYGDYSAIPLEAWREFDRAMATWQRLRRERYGGEISKQNPKRPKQRRAS